MACLRSIQLAKLCWYATRACVNAWNAFGMHDKQLHDKLGSYKLQVWLLLLSISIMQVGSAQTTKKF